MKKTQQDLEDMSGFERVVYFQKKYNKIIMGKDCRAFEDCDDYLDWENEVF